MEEADKIFYKSLLMKERDDFLDTLNKMDRHGIGIPGELSSTELSSYDNHPAELGTEVYSLGMNQNLKKNEKYQLREIDEAMQKLEKGNFGICEFCGQDIQRERLEVRPQARLCIKCENARDVDMEYLKKERPIEEDVMGSPFNKKYLNKQEDDEYEGLDYLNDLMKYGSASTPQDMGGYKDYKEYYTNEIDEQGIVDKTDNISNEQYKKTIED